MSRSVAIILDAQDSSGAIPASPVPSEYSFAWLRDGSWCALALDMAGQHDAAAAWHAWVAETLLFYGRKIRRLLADERLASRAQHRLLPARYTLQGRMDAETARSWPNSQVDSYGVWLWALAAHVKKTRRLTSRQERAARLAVEYLLAVGDAPSYDCWEEYPGLVHAATLAAVAAGLRDGGSMLQDTAAVKRAGAIRRTLTGPAHTFAGGFVKSTGEVRVDASLLWLAVPFGVVDVRDPTFDVTYERVRSELLVPGGGVRRYLGDGYYGGGQWPILAGSLAWVALRRGDIALADGLASWIDGTADDAGFLPEQTVDSTESGHMRSYWLERRGAPIRPLLWSHAMQIVLHLERGRQRE